MKKVAILTNGGDAPGLNAVIRAIAMNPEAVVVAMGCYVETGKDIAEQTGIDVLIGNNDRAHAHNR